MAVGSSDMKGSWQSCPVLGRRSHLLPHHSEMPHILVRVRDEGLGLGSGLGWGYALLRALGLRAKAVVAKDNITMY